MSVGAEVRVTNQEDAGRWAVVALLSLYVVLQITHAWMVDDAYITLRTVDNFVNGYGLRWNVAERVQSYTHPLWMFLLSAVYAFTREAFFTTVFVSFVLSIVAIWVVLRRLERFQQVLFLAVLLGSKAFLDYSTSGLENPLTHLLLALFFSGQLARGVDRRLMLIAALTFVNRMDTILFVVPAILHAGYEARARWRAWLGELAVAASPAFGWVAFALFYYGTVVPNTAIAKISGARVTRAESLQAGVVYFLDSALLDPLTLTAIGVSVAISLGARNSRVRAAGAGVLLYVLYVLVAGGMGTHMGFRFFSGALFVSALLLAHEATSMTQTLGAVAMTATFLVASTVSPLRVGMDSYATHSVDRGRGVVIDTRRFVMNEGGALLNLVPREPMPRHPWYLIGRGYRDNPEPVHVGGVGEFLAIGYCGYAAGPAHYFVDVLGLSDPLIARIPLAKRPDFFRPGHPERRVPDGYVESVTKDENLIADPDLKQYYEPLRIITRGPLWSFDRLATIAKFQLGAYDSFMHAFAARHQLRTP